MPFQFQRLEIPDILLVEARSTKDDRGYFMETYKQSVFVAQGIPHVFTQDNHSHSVHRVYIQFSHCLKRASISGLPATFISGCFIWYTGLAFWLC